MNARKFTTPEVSEICGVSVSTIVNWVESGKLKAYTTLGGHRRIHEKDLIDFLKQNKIPIPEELSLISAKKILLIDDEQGTIDYLTHVIKGSGIEYTIDTAMNGFEAGDKFNQFKPCLVILDINLPGINGYDICGMIKKEAPDTKVIAISADTADDTRLRIIKAGADMFMSKPIDPDKLLAELKKI